MTVSSRVSFTVTQVSSDFLDFFPSGARVDCVRVAIESPPLL